MKTFCRKTPTVFPPVTIQYVRSAMDSKKRRFSVKLQLRS